jgi:hypothetical protein
MSRHRKLGKIREILVLISLPFYHRKKVGQLIFRCQAIQFCRMDFKISALIGMNLGDLKSLVSVGEVPPDPTESRRKKSPVSRKRVKAELRKSPKEQFLARFRSDAIKLAMVSSGFCLC